MCGTCGCSDGSKITLSDGTGEHAHLLPDGSVIRHSHTSRPPHTDGHGLGHGGVRQVVDLEVEVLQKNDRLAARNREWLAKRAVLACNLMSSPGAGKTTLLARLLRGIGGEVGVLEGDQETDNDARTLRETGARVIQINTGTGCHLEADMVWAGLRQLAPPPGASLFIENVGNLVCPALFDLGEDARIVLFSVTEGEDKPLKYPHMFRSADLVLLTKTDLLPHLDFDVQAALGAVEAVRPGTPVLQLSAKTGEGLSALYDWLGQRRQRLAGAGAGS